ncbi:uncharacterized protein [Triticum aestivum]|uniref:uncharacterized protein n=1 Tax=Triticum aestivum TaxID=4565 RepID=UPI001D00C5D2|nr:uncharacterized protein LOC123147470 [Triticum aestivum]
MDSPHDATAGVFSATPPPSTVGTSEGSQLAGSLRARDVILPEGARRVHFMGAGAGGEPLMFTVASEDTVIDCNGGAIPAPQPARTDSGTAGMPSPRSQTNVDHESSPPTSVATEGYARRQR